MSKHCVKDALDAEAEESMLNNPDQPKHGLFGSLWRKLRNVFVFFFDRLLDGSEKGKPKQRSDYCLLYTSPSPRD